MAGTMSIAPYLLGNLCIKGVGFPHNGLLLLSVIQRPDDKGTDESHLFSCAAAVSSPR